MGDSWQSKILVIPVTTPDSDEQVKFLVNIQRLLAEGLFVATYKYALLMALADIAVEKGRDDSSELEISTRLIAEKFIVYYWRQCSPADGGGLPPPAVAPIRALRASEAAAVFDSPAKHGETSRNCEFGGTGEDTIRRLNHGSPA